MCGIAGIMRTDGGAIEQAWLDRLDRRITHRGPDGRGSFRDRVQVTVNGSSRTIEVALIHRRLSIIDPEGGDQPMVSEHGRCDRDGLIAVVFNGCIYNHRELRRELESAGHAFQTDHSDTEVLIHGYRQWGPDFENHLEGMYAFALWDRGSARLMLGRDRFGEKPLYLRWGLAGDPQALAFSSDAAALAELDDQSLPRDTTAVHRWAETYLQLGTNWMGCTIYDAFTQSDQSRPSGVFALPPTIVDKRDQLIASKPRRETPPIEFENRIENAVKERLEADVPLGCFLSGGIDSSLIAAFAKRHKPDIQTFTVRMPDERYDESPHAEAVAEHLGTDHQTLDVSINPAEDLVFLIETLGQPFGDSSILPTYWVSKAARQHVKVALSGDGGDELFLGYERYMAARALRRHRRILRWVPSNFLLRHHPKTRRHKLGRLGVMAREYPVLGVLAMESIFSQKQLKQLLRTELEHIAAHIPGNDALLALRAIDLQQYLPNDLLCKVDTASMAVALEVRCPYLDSKVVDAALNAPTWLLAPNMRRKGLLRDIAAKHLPEHVIHRPKMGFAVPIGEWFRDDTGGMQTLLLDSLSARDPFGPIELDRTAVDRLLDEHLTGGFDHGQRLFTLLTLAIWAQRVHDAEPCAKTPDHEYSLRA